MMELRHELGKVIYEARLKLAWGASWVHRTPYPDFGDPKVRRAYPHNPISDVDLALAAADAVLEKWSLTPHPD